MRKNSGNIFLVILVVLGILATSVGGYFWWSSSIKTLVDKQNFAPNYSKQIPDTKPKEATSSADKTTKWNTFINSKFNFQFKYPDNWFLDDWNNFRTRVDNQPLQSEMGEGPFYSGYISFEIRSKLPYEVQISDPIGTKKQYEIDPISHKLDAFYYEKVGSLTVGEKQGAKIEIVDTQGKIIDGPWIEVDLGKDKLRINNQSQDKDKLLILDQILSTFKFID